MKKWDKGPKRAKDLACLGHSEACSIADCSEQEQRDTS